MNEEPRASITMGTHNFCARHLSPFRPDWPLSIIRAIEPFTLAILNDELFIAACTPEGEELADASLATERLVAFNPVCCYLGEERMKVVYEAAGVEPPK